MADVLTAKVLIIALLLVLNEIQLHPCSPACFHHHKILWDHHQLSYTDLVIEDCLTLVVHYLNSHIPVCHLDYVVGVPYLVWCHYSVLQMITKNFSYVHEPVTKQMSFYDTHKRCGQKLLSLCFMTLAMKKVELIENVTLFVCSYIQFFKRTTL